MGSPAAGEREIFVTPPDLRTVLERRQHPVLFVGPMSRNCVTAAVRYASAIRKPIPLIASRRQVEAAELGGGYVERWSTESFASFVRSLGGTNTPVCRDHGGPWQGADEEGLGTAAAMERAKVSIADDLRHGFEVIHLDPSIGEESRPTEETLDMLFELYAFTLETAEQLGRPVEVEVGTEQQSGQVAGPEDLVAFLKAVTRFCRKGDRRQPLFCVVQTGTLVRETRNVGLTEGRRNEEFDQKYAVSTMERNVRALADLAYINGVFVKEHNGDYLSDGSMASRTEWELGGVNIAPEFGVLETRTLLSLCSELRLDGIRDDMLELFYRSGKWDKWLCRDSKATATDRAVIAGHYCFADPSFIDLRRTLDSVATNRGIDVDAIIQHSLTGHLRRMTWCLGYHGASNEQVGCRDVGRALDSALVPRTLRSTGREAMRAGSDAA